MQYEIRGDVSNFIEEFIVPNGKLADKNIWKGICEKADNKNENVSVNHICNTLITCKKFFDENPYLNIVDFLAYILNNVVMIYVICFNIGRCLSVIFYNE